MRRCYLKPSADPTEGGSSDTIGINHVVVIPSTQLDFHLHSNAAMAARQRHLEEQDCTFTDGNCGDDFMTPPTVLLKRALKQAEQLRDKMIMLTKHEVGEVKELDCWIRCVALARIVHGQSHWVLGKTHIQLGKAYLEIKALPKQALLHISKGLDILLRPECRKASCDADDEIKYQQAMAHCVAGQAYTLQGTFSKAQQELLKAKRVLDETLSSGCAVAPATASDDDIGNSGVGFSASHYQLQMELTTALARLNLKRERFSNAKKHFTDSIDLTKSVLGPDSSRLVPLLRGKATAEANLSLYGSAVQSLEDAQEIAESLYGSESMVMADLLQAQVRLSIAQLKSGASRELDSTEQLFSKAVLLFTALLGGTHQKTLTCKGEYCIFLASCSEYREKAILPLQKLIEDKKEALGELDAEVGHSLKLLSSLFLERGKLSQASMLLKEAKLVYSCSLGDKHKDTQAVTRLLESLTWSTFHRKSSWRL